MATNNSQEERVVTRKIGKRKLKIGVGHNLPQYLERHPLYDRALPRIAASLKGINGSLRFIDIGANIGDTVSLVSDRVDGDFLCIEADKKYTPLLKSNVKIISGSTVKVVESYVGEVEESGKSMRVMRENGTARIEEAEESGAAIKLKPLDDILVDNPSFMSANLLKIDTDGFEYTILKSGQNFIKKSRPLIFFEFDPEFYGLHMKEPLEVFDYLRGLGYEQALVYENFGVPVALVDTNDRKTLNSLVKKIDKEKIYYYDILAWHRDDNVKYGSIATNEMLLVIDVLAVRASEAEASLASTTSDLAEVRAVAESALRNYESAAAELAGIKNSSSWKVARLFSRVATCMMPRGSMRRKVFLAPLKLARSIKRFLRSVLRALRITYNGLDLFFIRPRRFRKRIINQKSKKIAYIGHSYHVKTQSTGFLIDYLKEHYEVEVISDESWQGGEYPDLSHLDDSYLAVIFFQLLPPKGALETITNENILFFPMYDQSGRRDYSYWKECRRFKIVNFSEVLHKKLVKWGFDSIFVRYFPKPDDYIPGKKDEAFFWQRLSFININTVSALFKPKAFKLHIHKAVDPDQVFTQPSAQQEKDYSITYSDWFEKREQMWDLIKEKAIYVAPREYEGIGLSFLEAMAMGKAVVAVDNPTMNEYISDGKTGYLFNLTNPKPIDFSKLKSVQEQTYDYMRRGYEEWTEKRKSILDFIERP